jgi:hypothetical protein
VALSNPYKKPSSVYVPKQPHKAPPAFTRNGHCHVASKNIYSEFFVGGGGRGGRGRGEPQTSFWLKKYSNSGKESIQLFGGKSFGHFLSSSLR